MTVVSLAKGLPLEGYVMNLPDGDVEMVVEGEVADIEALLTRIRSSHLGRHVSDTRTQWSSASGDLGNFGIRFY